LGETEFKKLKSIKPHPLRLSSYTSLTIIPAMKILIVEDHLATAESLKCYLSSKHEVELASSCQQAEKILAEFNVDLLILDLGLPDGSGIAFCEKDSVNHVPTLILSGRCDTHTKVAALDAGADDYLAKPFSPSELLARINALLRRYKSQVLQSVTKIGHLVLKDHAIEYRGRTTSLTSVEQKLLRELVRSAYQVVSKTTLTQTLDGGDAAEKNNSLESHIKNIRRKLGISRSDHFLETIYGVGYRLNPSYG
jgi:two-component system, OmpR family, response regulator